MNEQEKRPFYLKNENMKVKFEDYQKRLREFKKSGASLHQDDDGELMFDDDMQ